MTKPKSQPKESKRTSRSIHLEDYDHTSRPNEFLEVTQWSNGEGFDLHISRDGQFLSLTWGEFNAMLAALGDWIEDDPDDEDICPHIVTSDEGTSFCKLAVATTEFLSRLKP